MIKIPYKLSSKKLSCKLKLTLENYVDNNALDVDMRVKSNKNNRTHIIRQAKEAINTGSITLDEFKQVMNQVRE